MFADDHGADFGRLLIARKKGDQFELADINEPATRKIARTLQSPNDLNSLFADTGRISFESKERAATLPAESMPGIQKTAGVCGGEARIAGTRIPVWVLVQARRLNMSGAEILRNYPSLKPENLNEAWKYAEEHQAEIDEDISSNENA